MRSRRWFCLRVMSVGALAAMGAFARPAYASRKPNEVMVGLQNNVFANLADGRPTGIMVEAIHLSWSKWESGRFTSSCPALK